VLIALLYCDLIKFSLSPARALMMCNDVPGAGWRSGVLCGRYVSNNKYKLVKTFQLDNAQQLTAFSAINSFHSCNDHLTSFILFLSVTGVGSGGMQGI